MTIRVVGLDSSTKSFGIALPNGETRTIAPRAGAGDNARRLNEIIYRLDGYLTLHRPDLVLIEEAIPPRFPTAALRLGELRGAVILRLFERGTPYLEVNPGTLKLYATGHGKASKEQMVAAAEFCGADVANDDEADAFWLYALGRHQYAPSAWEPAFKATELREIRTGVRARIVWPRIDMAATRG